MSYDATEEELKLLREMFDVLRFCQSKINEQLEIAYKHYLYKVIDSSTMTGRLLEADDDLGYLIKDLAEYLNPLYKEPIKEYR